MKSCPTCNRTYPDDTLAFCLMDGSVLSAPYDPNEPASGSGSRGGNSLRTEVLSVETQETPKPSLASTVQSPIPPQRMAPAQSTILAPTPEVPGLHAHVRAPNVYQVPQTGTAPVSILLRSAFAVRGMITILFGLLMGLAPGLSFVEQMAVFGACCLVGGAVSVMAGIKALLEFRGGFFLLIDGLVLFLVAVFQLAAWQSDDASPFALPIGIFLSGIWQILTALQLRKLVAPVWPLAAAGAMSLACGLLLLTLSTVFL